MSELDVVAMCINIHINERRITKKEADVLAARIVGGCEARNINLNTSKFYELCGLEA